MRHEPLTPCPRGRIVFETIPGNELPGYDHQSLRDALIHMPVWLRRRWGLD
jgi:hypothetical protein